MSDARPSRILARELALFVGAALVTLIATWPLGLHLFSFDRLTDRTLDDHVYWWDFWWLRQALLVRHVDPLFCPDVFWPHGASLVVSPFALPFGLLSLPMQAAWGDLPGAVAAVKVVAFLTFPLAIVGTSLLLRRLGVPWIASVLAGCFFAFTPFRMLHLGRVHYLAGAFTPWFLHAALVAMRTARVRWVAAAGAWFALCGATDASLLLELLLASGALWGFELLRGSNFKATTVRLVACGAMGVVLLSPLLARFLREARDNRGADVAARLDYDFEPGGVQRILSPDLEGLAWYCAPALEQATRMSRTERDLPAQSKSSARLTADIYESFRPESSEADLEAAVAALVVLAVAIALGCSLRERGAWLFLLLAAIGFVLALGPKRGSGDGTVTMPYAWLAEIVPGMAAGRYPPAQLRIFHLGVAIAAGLAFARPRGWLLGGGGLALAAFLAVAPLRPLQLGAVLTEEVYDLIASDPKPGAVLELPPRREIVLRRMALGQIQHHRPLMSGPLTRVPPEAWSFFTDEPVAQRLLHPPLPRPEGDPDLAREVEENVAALKRYGVRFIVVRRALFGADAGAFDWLLTYLARHHFPLRTSREGHVVALVE